MWCACITLLKIRSNQCYVQDLDGVLRLYQIVASPFLVEAAANSLSANKREGGMRALHVAVCTLSCKVTTAMRSCQLCLSVLEPSVRQNLRRDFAFREQKGRDMSK